MNAPPGEWEPVTNGESGATVFRSADGARYAKCVPAGQRDLLARERDRVDWLAATAVNGPEVLDWADGPEGACLVTSTVRGVPADTVSSAELRRAWPSIVEAVRELHALPAGDCPFTRDLARMFALAEDVVARGAVTTGFLPVEQQGTLPAELLARLTEQLDHRLAQEPADTVVCHGDLCLPNIVLDRDALEFAGFLDLGRLGLADRYADISLLLANSRETWDDDDQAVVADREFAGRHGIALDADRQRFYLHLDPLTWG
ncbi:APH(3'') family aminoglycoside O-phosphotransferase [Amycolatopsis sp. CA-230715]|uniref:APH(3'') family aminoglycoside O-phosphotransferase n=1 Tax=Amycolatopsis sp. CA-230715 TaxID=2745196 RepID=UPI001C017DDF|nr:APH(3'') family aminoglycoside O-phosphotransferase [Amycolatopsis sp. CA-230715]QWF84010.1 Aminoglycoside 3'-phosphotransferase [Amycolatopsis sp. CA-230715]